MDNHRKILDRFLLVYFTILACSPNLFLVTANTLPLPFEAYSEGHCVIPEIVPIELEWMERKTFFVPVASQLAYRRFAETLLSRPPASETELQAMCITIHPKLDDYTSDVNFTIIGYDNRSFRKTCYPDPEDRDHINCMPTLGSPGVNPTRSNFSQEYVVEWDEINSYFILVRCVEGFFKDFLMLSTKPTLTLNSFNKVLNVARKYGFNTRRIQTMGYNRCINAADPNAMQLLAAPYANNWGINSGNNFLQASNNFPQSINQNLNGNRNFGTFLNRNPYS